MKYLLGYEYILRLIYKHRNSETRSMSMVLAYLLLFLNIHSILIWTELEFDIIMVSSFWRPSAFPKAPLGSVIGILLYVLISYKRQYALKNLSNIERINQFRQIIFKFNGFRKPAFVYLVITLLGFGWSVITLSQLIHR